MVRICQHKGISFRTGKTLSTMSLSKIRENAIEKNHPIKEINFKILDSCNRNQLRLLESIYIHQQNSNLNDQASSAPLFILK